MFFVMTTPPPPPPASRQEERHPKDPAFEKLHPRDSFGRFAVKSAGDTTSAEPLPPEAQKFISRAVVAARRFGIYLPPISWTSGDLSSMLSKDGEQMEAYSLGDRVVLSPELVDSLRRGELAMMRYKKTGMPPSPEFIAALYAVVHESLHHANPYTDQQTSDEYDADRLGDEGIVDAVALDIMTKWIDQFGGVYSSSTLYPRYKDNVVDIRKLSGKATGTKWTSKRAQSWRLKLLGARPALRRRMLEYARSL